MHSFFWCHIVLGACISSCILSKLCGADIVVAWDCAQAGARCGPTRTEMICMMGCFRQGSREVSGSNSCDSDARGFLPDCVGSESQLMHGSRVVVCFHYIFTVWAFVLQPLNTTANPTESRILSSISSNNLYSIIEL